LNGLLGSPGDNQSLATQMTNLANVFAIASQAPTASASRTGMMNALNNLASTFSSVSGTITSLQAQVDHQVVNSTSSTNTPLKQIFDLNAQIKNAMASGTSDGSSGLLDQRDVALSKLSKIMAIKTSANPDGS